MSRSPRGRFSTGDARWEDILFLSARVVDVLVWFRTSTLMISIGTHCSFRIRKQLSITLAGLGSGKKRSSLPLPYHSARTISSALATIRHS